VFDWLSFLDQHGIAYRRDGGNARIACPFCDPGLASGHWWMSINLKGRGWKCWQKPEPGEHRGVKATRLVAALLKISIAEARAITGERYQELDNIKDRVDALLNGAIGSGAIVSRQLPKEFKPFTRMPPSAMPFAAYLRGRDFTDAAIARMTEDYGIYYAVSGDQRYRVIFTVWEDRLLKAWTGRTITHTADLRYRTSSHKDGPSIGHHLLWFDDLLRGGDRIAVCEGPFDALKLRTLGLPATCFFTAKPSAEQVGRLNELLPRYRERLLILDQGTLPTALAVQGMLTSLPIRVVHLPPKIKDPGLLTDLEFLNEAHQGI